ncbi:MAG: hypothetical protein IPM13_18795 [Phycisphaerales bacterium]|nr:hypothetical protein [Phycisphaerales bacterium]
MSSPTEDDPYGVVVTVRDWRGAVVSGARVLASEQAMGHSSTIAELVAMAEDEPCACDGATGPDGQVRFAYRPKSTYYIRVEGPDGMPATHGAGTFDTPTRGLVRLEYALGRFFAAAIRLADGSDPLFAHAKLGGQIVYRPMPNRVGSELRSRLAGRLGLPLAQVFVDIPQDCAPDEIAGRLSVYHAGIGWFEAPLTWTPLDRATVTSVAVPAGGVAPPLRVMIECVDAHDRPVARDDILLVSDDQPLGFPAFGRVVTSGRTALLAPGKYSIRDRHSVGSECLTPRSVEIRDGTTLRLRMQWSVATTTLTLTRHGRPYRGPVTVQVEPHDQGGCHMQCERFPEAGLPLSLRVDRANTIAVTIRGDTRKLRFAEGGVPRDCHLGF